MEFINKSFSLLNLKNIEIYLLDHFNISLLQNGNFNLIDHIFTNFAEKIYQCSIIDCVMSDHQLISCT